MKIQDSSSKKHHPGHLARHRREIGRAGCRSLPPAAGEELGHPVHQVVTPATERLLYDLLHLT